MKPHKTGLISDVRLLDHTCAKDHPQCPERLSSIMALFEKEGYLVHKVVDYRHVITREATNEELSLAYSHKYIDYVNNLWPKLSHRKDLTVLDSYVNQHSAFVARLAVGGCLQGVDGVMGGDWPNAFCLVRPPGHHSGYKNTINGFCIFNSAAIAARYAQQHHGAKKVVIFDYDVHHGDGTQRIFDKDNTVLFISMHRHDRGIFYPAGDAGFYANCGQGEALGTKVNIPWNQVDEKFTNYPFQAPGDNEYIYAYTRIVEPIIKEFEPDLIITSSGFDAARYDPLGGFTVTPNAYYYITRRLMKLGKPLLSVLEGGYHEVSTSESALGVLKALVGESEMPEKVQYGFEHIQDYCHLEKEHFEQVEEFVNFHMQHWKSLDNHQLRNYSKSIQKNSERRFGVIEQQPLEKANSEDAKTKKKQKKKKKNVQSDDEEQTEADTPLQFFFAAGHVQKFKNFSINKDRFLKQTLEEELTFYKSGFPESEFAPKFYGVEGDYIIMENLLFKQKTHTVLDIKLSRQSQNPNLTEAKREKQAKKEEMSTAHSLGFRVGGITTNKFKQGGLLINDQAIVLKLLGKVVTAQNKGQFLDYLTRMVAVLKEVRRSYYGTSIILIKGDKSSVISWVDFHYWYDKCETYDHNLVQGLQNLINFIKQVSTQ